MSELVQYLDGWSPDPVLQSDRVGSWPVDAFAALLDQPSPLGLAEPAALPPLWHWFGFLDHVPQAELGADGHPADGRFLPPIPHRRRMFAGGRWRAHRPLPVDAPVSRRSAVSSVETKIGRGGELAFVTVRSEFTVHGELAAVEEQDIVYRSQPDPTADRTTSPTPNATPSATPSGTAAEQATQPTQPAAEHELVLHPDAAVLFRFSALTYNTHRIHYDLPYATGIEGYPGLVVHGPLLALLALELPRRYQPDRRVAEFRYRLRRPAFAGTPVRAWSEPVGGDGWVELAVGVPGQPPSLTGSARLTGEG